MKLKDLTIMFVVDFYAGIWHLLQWWCSKRKAE